MKPRVRWETSRGRYDVVQQQFSLSKKPRLSIQEELESAQKVVSCKCGATPVLTWNLHTTQSNYFAPTKQEGCQSPRLAEKQRIKRMVWKMNVNSKSGQRANDEGMWCKRCLFQCKRMDRGPQFTRGVSP